MLTTLSHQRVLSTFFAFVDVASMLLDAANQTERLNVTGRESAQEMRVVDRKST
jgi:hypothetical protein